jgi:hypothetical protein
VALVAMVATALTHWVAWLVAMVVLVAPAVLVDTLKPSWLHPLPLVTRAMVPRVVLDLTVRPVARVARVAPVVWLAGPSEPRVQEP